MRLLVITTATKDYGDRFVVRVHVDGVAEIQPVAVCGTLEEARGAVEEFSPSLVRLAPNEFDDPVIVESWGENADVELCRVAQEVLRGAFL